MQCPRSTKGEPNDVLSAQVLLKGLCPKEERKKTRALLHRQQALEAVTTRQMSQFSFCKPCGQLQDKEMVAQVVEDGDTLSKTNKPLIILVNFIPKTGLQKH